MDLEEEIKKLEIMLAKLRAEKDKNKIVVDPTSPVVGDAIENKKLGQMIYEAKKTSKKQAGTVQSTDDGSVDEKEVKKEKQQPTTSIHEFEDMENCVCECHNSGKKDCMYCYDHPEHLAKNKSPYEDNI